jgi:hypothetical protein
MSKAIHFSLCAPVHNFKSIVPRTLCLATPLLKGDRDITNFQAVLRAVVDFRCVVYTDATSRAASGRQRRGAFNYPRRGKERSIESSFDVRKGWRVATAGRLRLRERWANKEVSTVADDRDGDESRRELWVHASTAHVLHRHLPGGRASQPASQPPKMCFVSGSVPDGKRSGGGGRSQ